MQLLKKLKKASPGWFLLTVGIIILLLIPNLNIIINLFGEAGENWEHVRNYLLVNYFQNSLILVLATGLLAAFLGAGLAWVIAAYNFPGRDFLSWGLILPLAIPPYIGAYVYQGMFSYTGPLQTFLRNKFQLRLSQQYFDFMNIRGAIFIYTIFLFPYVFLMTRAFLSKQSASLLESSRLLGKSDNTIFFKIILPLSRGAVVAGSSLVMMEVLNDYGVVKYFGISTFTTAIFKSWFGMGDLPTSVRLAVMAMLVIFVVLFIEKLLRGGRKYSYSTSNIRPVSRRKLEGSRKVLAQLFTYGVFFFGFLLPTAQLLYWSFLSRSGGLMETLHFAFTSFLTGGGAAILILTGAVIIATTARMSSNFVSNLLARVTILGYSIPGAVIAVGVLLFMLQLDGFLSFLQTGFGIKANIVLSSTLVMLIFAYAVRFMGIAFNSVNSGYEKIGESYFEASRTLGKGVTETFFKIDLPMLKPALMSGFLLVFIEIMKELPLTMILRPFNFDTLATKAFEYASDEMIYRAADLSLVLIFFSAAAIYLITHHRRRKK
ncbi:iron(III) transport system permease protein [Halanaerobium congolense]|jgi:iron(III) transport system permease protein|uniref:Iron(III) transport system permease protein n=1 Tax=Halanaerobium congolense TaxID=54121 RepID=A0A1H9ZYS9_9FIRM|nr:iron ABC transporter permease [Halanaerobium congolense]PTX16150.1 iron(III) transport system permease protein [Halanaerobium congolense]SDF28310.1 iron(III) transport system permease protein [Halanaerobium congolense]SES86928.1 iron(III) transport system permease protein [Halanaerobium congolense]SFP29952.1 iron(III) transport system permease protein [Halanaerobium congolense]